MRALLIVNPRATSTTLGRRNVITRALAADLDLEVVQTRYRGHAHHVAAGAVKDGYDLVLVFGGDGTVHEVINGLLSVPGTGDGPLLAALPGGNANVFIRCLGLPADPVDATGEILAALAAGRSRAIGLGLAGDTYFCINAGLGIDAEVVRVVEGWRARRDAASTGLYLWAAVRQFLSVTDRRVPALTLHRPSEPAMTELFCGFISNTSPWTYLGHRPVNPSPRASFATGLDVFALSKLSTMGALNAVRQMLSDTGRTPHGRHIVTLHDQSVFTFTAARPVALQLDGEYVGECENVDFRAIPAALRVIAADPPLAP